MEELLIVLFWISISSIVFAYFGYPLSLVILSKFKAKHFKYDNSYDPRVLIIIAAANEEKNIASKLDNTLALLYPSDKLQIIVASDASTDKTVEVVINYIDANKDRDIQLVHLEEKGGKEAAQKEALNHAIGDVVVFTDVATTLDPLTIQLLVGHFGDPKIGAVDGMSKIIKENGTVSGEGAYLRYENKIRVWESKLGSIVSCGGCLFAARKEVLEDFSDSLQSDFRTALKSVELGYQSITDPHIEARFKDTANPEKEYNRKIRTVVRGINNLFHHLHLLNPKRYGLFSYQLFCHKLLKWLVPFFMILALFTTVVLNMLTTNIFWPLMQLLQLTFYIVAAYGYTYKYEKFYFKIPAFFVMSNLAILKAWILYLKGERFVSWTPTKR